MTDLRFERIAQIVAIAAVGSSDKGISRYFVESDTVKIRFSEYVKSQVHLNVVRGLYNRSLREYVEALYFLKGKTSCESSALSVLQYFYSDLANFLINNGYDVHLVIEVDTTLFSASKKLLDVAQLQEEMLSGFDKVISGNLAVNQWEYSAILDYVKDANDLKKKAKSYALASKLLKENESQSLSLIESR